ncbi:MAG: hypothetical protein Q9195_008046 [Heterodermia aff. obscurata]
MSHLTYTTPPGRGETLLQKFHFNQAVRISNRIEISGQTGTDPSTGAIPPSAEEQIANAFRNVSIILEAAGATKGWGAVYKVRSYHVGLDEEHSGAMVKQMRKWCPEHAPLWTAVGVTGLARGGLVAEIEVVGEVKGDEIEI